MRGTRSKAYRKLMHQYALTFKFREPYQVLLDSQMIQVAARCKMDLVHLLERTLQGTVKPMITQCDMRHLYATKDSVVIDQAKGYERRHCDHHELDQPLSTLECLSQVVDPKDSRTNKHRYVVASQDPEVRALMRSIPGVPLVYIHRSVMILEPMATSTEEIRDREEKGKFKAGIRGKRNPLANQKRQHDEHATDVQSSGVAGGDAAPLKKRKRGPKGPNPLSVKQSKKLHQQPENEAALDLQQALERSLSPHPTEAGKSKRKRRHKARGAEAHSETHSEMQLS